MAHQPLFIGTLKTFTEGENGNVEFLPCNGWACSAAIHLCLASVLSVWAHSRSLEMSQILEAWENRTPRLIPMRSVYSSVKSLYAWAVFSLFPRPPFPPM